MKIGIENTGQQAKNKLPDKYVQLFYLYFALLPLMSFLFLYFNKDIWDNYLNFIDYSEHPVVSIFYHVFCIIAYAYSGMVAVFIIQSTPVPKNKLLILLIIFDAPVTLFIDFVSGYDVSFADIIIFDFVFAMIAFAIAELILSVKPKKVFVAGIYAILVASTYYGVHTYNLLKEASTKNLILYTVNFILTVWVFYKVLKNRRGLPVHSIGKIQKKMSKIAFGTGFIGLYFIIFAYLKTIWDAMFG
jgi:hypothetical protein